MGLGADGEFEAIERTLEQGWPVCSIGLEVCSQVAEKAFDYLDAPPTKITGKDVPMPYAANLEKLALPSGIFQSNNACATIPEYDRLYEQSIRIPASPERDRLYHEMTRIIETYAPWRLDISRYRNMLVQPRVLGYKKHPILHSEWKYIDVDTGKKRDVDTGTDGG